MESPASPLDPAAQTKKPLVVGIPKELYLNERRVAATPATVDRICKLGLEVRVQSGAGEGASILDAEYAEAGATLVQSAEDLWAAADIVLKVRAPGPIPDPAGPLASVAPRIHKDHEADLLKEKAAIISFLWPAQNKDLIDRLAARRATVLAMDMVPRISRAQKLDALSAMANIAGYKAVIEAAHHYGRFLGGQMTAAGRVKPAQVLVIGAGVAGLAAIAAARSLGAVVRAFDTRPVVREQIESLGGEFIEFKFDSAQRSKAPLSDSAQRSEAPLSGSTQQSGAPLTSESTEGAGGYAKQMSDAYLAAEQALIALHCASSDIVITTALIPGVPAPQLITSGAVVGMKRGSVIVDLAAEQGGNCVLTERDRVVEKYGVTLIGLTDLTSRMARQSSELYAATVLQLLREVIQPDGSFQVDHDDEIERGVLVLEGGKLMWPPPKPVQRAGAPQPGKDVPKAHPPAKVSSPWPARIGAVVAAAVLLPIGLFAPPAFLQHFTVFILACVVGWHVIWNVTPALHTPLMSVTNAISGIILIGGMLLSAGQTLSAATVLGAVAVLLASINVAGGFLVTQRMLRMFRR